MKRTIITSDKCNYVLVSLLILMAIPIYFYGPRAAIIAGIALVTAFVCEMIGKRWFFHLPQTERYDFSSAVTAMIITLLLPPTVDYYIVIIAVVVALFIGKYAFGGTGKNIFNPAALGVAVVGISFPDQVITFPVPGSSIPLDFHIPETADILFQPSFASTLKLGGTPSIDRMDLFLGNFPGAMGATCIIVLVIIGLLLCISKVISFRIILSSLLTVAAFAAVFPRLNTGRVNSMIFELTSGVLLYGIIFMASDPYTSPLTSIGQVLYGVFLAFLTMLFRQIDSLEIEFVYVVLFANAFAKEFDRLSDFLREKIPFLKRIIDSSEAIEQSRIRKVGGNHA